MSYCRGLEVHDGEMLYGVRRAMDGDEGLRKTARRSRDEEELFVELEDKAPRRTRSRARAAQGTYNMQIPLVGTEIIELIAD